MTIAAKAAPTLNISPSGKGVGQSAAIDVFEFAAQRYAVRDTAGLDAAAAHHFADNMRRGFTLHRGIRGEDDLFDYTLIQARGELVQADLLRTDAVHRRQVPH